MSTRADLEKAEGKLQMQLCELQKQMAQIERDLKEIRHQKDILDGEDFEALVKKGAARTGKEDQLLRQHCNERGHQMTEFRRISDGGGGMEIYDRCIVCGWALSE